MAGLYIHIPFCASRCIYCNFYSTTHAELQQRYVDSVCREMEMRGLPPAPSSKKEAINTIYLGGGTPSQLTLPQLRQIFLYINKVYKNQAEEVTIEMNPDDVTVEYAAELRQLGINRVSMGAQTFNDERLRFLHRRHTASQVEQAVKILRDAGIHNISIDLMYGFPNETLEDWEHDIDAALTLNVEHISAYCLSIEEGTPLARIMETGCLIGSSQKTSPLIPCDEELERQMYELLLDKLEAAGYEHYEISNFAKVSPMGEGWRGLHNSSYWKDIPYIGVGAAAHSYDGKKRSWNVSDIKQYIDSIEHGERPCEYEDIDNDTHYNDCITTALRTSDGLDLTTLSERHKHYCMKEAQKYIDDGLLHIIDNHLALTRKGLFVSDYIMSSLILV
jgi:oxygen-independent coproporphyrinogen-3 oxidase